MRTTDAASLLERLRAACRSAAAVDADAVPEGLVPLLLLSPSLEALAEEVESVTARAEASDDYVHQLLDHLRVVEIAMGSLRDSRDDAARALAETRLAAGVAVDVVGPIDLAGRVAALRRESEAATERSARLTAALLLCRDHMCAHEGQPLPERIAQALREALDR